MPIPGATTERSHPTILMYFTERPYRYVPEDEVIKHGGFFGLTNKFLDAEKGTNISMKQSLLKRRASRPSCSMSTMARPFAWAR